MTCSNDRSRSTKPALRLSTIVLSALLGGCNALGSTQIVTIAELAQSGKLTFDRAQGTADPPGGTLDVDIGARACPSLSADARVTVDGREATLSRGGVGRPVAGAPLELEPSCNPPIFHAASDLVPGPTTEMEIEDPSGSIRMVVTAFAAPRSLALLSSPDGKLRRGDTVTVGWSPGSDQLEVTSAGLTWNGDGSEFPTEIAGGGKSLSAVGKAFSFTVPQDAPIGAGHFVLRGGDFKPEITTCTGIATCKADVFARDIDLPAQIVP